MAGWLRTGEVAELFGVTPSTVARWARRGSLPSIHTVGGHHRFLEVEVMRLFEDEETSPTLPHAGATVLAFVRPAKAAAHGGPERRRRGG